MRIIAKTFQGLEGVLQKELQNLGATQINPLTRAVEFHGSRYTLYAANLFLRTALRIIVPLLETSIKDENDLYKAIYNINWTDIFDVNQTFAVFANTSSSQFSHSKYIALKGKDAIADRFRKEKGKRPDVDTIDPDYRIDIHIRQNQLTVSLDSTGTSLHMRGYRKNNVPAPLNEVMAAGLIFLSEWNGDTPLFDPMCGSGTILSEAWLLSRGIMPQNPGRKFIFKNWKDFDADIFLKVIKEYKPEMMKRPGLYGSDIDHKAVDASLSNLSIIKAHDIKVIKRDFFITYPPVSNGLIIINPPYDVRLHEADIQRFYKRIGDTMKNRYTGWRACIFSGNENALKSIGLRPNRRFSLLNGPILSKMLIFDLYEGTRKVS